MAISLSLRAAILAVLFIFSARVLGAADFGVVVFLLAITSILAPFSNLGLDYLVLRSISRNDDHSDTILSVSINWTLLVGISLSVLTVIMTSALNIVEVEFLIVCVFMLGELLGQRLVEIYARLFQAKNQIYRLAFVRIIMPIGRMGFLLVGWWLVKQFDVEAWLFLNGLAVMTVLIGIVLISNKGTGSEYSLNKWEPRLLAQSHRFLWGGAAFRISNDADKLVISKLDGVVNLGVYGAGYKIIEMGLLPFQSVLTVFSSKIYRAFSDSVKEGIGQVRRLVFACLAVNVAVVAALVLVSQFLSEILGASYKSSESVVLSLAILPLLMSLRSSYSLALQALDRQGLNSIILAVNALAKVLLIFLLVYFYGWVGAIVAALVAEAVLCMTTLIVYRRLIKRASYG